EGMRLVVVVEDVRQILAWNPEPVRVVVVAGSEDDRGGAPLAPVREPEHEPAVRAFDPAHLLPEGDPEPVGVGRAAVVAQRLPLRRLFVRRDEGQAADLQQVGGREERHVAREMEDRVHEQALLQHLVAEAGLHGRDRDREPCRTRAHDQEIGPTVFHDVDLTWRARGIADTIETCPHARSEPAPYRSGWSPSLSACTPPGSRPAPSPSTCWPARRRRASGSSTSTARRTRSSPASRWSRATSSRRTST